MGFLAGYMGEAPIGAAETAPAREARRRLAHRGANSAGWAVQPRGAGHALLLASAVRTGPRLTIAFDGRLANRAALVAALRQHGHAPRGAGRLERDGASPDVDTELLEAAWHCWGLGMLPRLEGAFAFAVLDARSGQVVLARDRFGQRPLLLANIDGAVCFASELSALLAWSGRKREFDPAVLSAILAFGHAPVACSPMAGVRRLPPGHLLTIRADGSTEQTCWWELPQGTDDATGLDAGEIARLIGATVRAQADAAPAMVLHQGEDSALLVKCLETWRPAATTLPLPNAQLVAALIERQGEPIVPEAAIPALAAGSEGGTLLAATGAGELLLTHRRYRLFAQALAGLRDAASRGARPRDGGFHAAPLSAREVWHAAAGGMGEADRLAVLGPALLHTAVLDAPAAYGVALCEAAPHRVMAEAARLDLALRIPARELAAFDAATSLTGASIVCPFLDSELVAALVGQPDAARRWLMQAALVPAPDLSAWHPMAAGLREMTEDILSSAACRERDLFSRGRVEALLRRHRATPGPDAAGLWALLGVELWCRAFLDAPAQPAHGWDCPPDEMLPDLASVAA